MNGNLSDFTTCLERMVEARNWRELHTTTTGTREWHAAHLKYIKERVKRRSFQLGISLGFVFDELEASAAIVWSFFWSNVEGQLRTAEHGIAGG